MKRTMETIDLNLIESMLHNPELAFDPKHQKDIEKFAKLTEKGVEKHILYNKLIVDNEDHLKELKNIFRFADDMLSRDVPTRLTILGLMIVKEEDYIHKSELANYLAEISELRKALDLERKSKKRFVIANVEPRRSTRNSPSPVSD